MRFKNSEFRALIFRLINFFYRKSVRLEYLVVMLIGLLSNSSGSPSFPTYQVH